jgi:hypothetical protein
VFIYGNGAGKSMRGWYLACSIIAAISYVASSVAAIAQDDAAFAREIETKYIFGFTEGSGIGLEGEKELSFDTDARIAKGARKPGPSRYWGSESKLEFEFTPNQYVQFEFGPILSGHSISNVPGLFDRNQFAFGGLFGEIRYLLLGRGPSSPLSVTVTFEPNWRVVDETSGDRVTNFEFETKLNIDYELIANRLYLGSNILYEPETTHTPGTPGWDKESTAGVSLALAYRVLPSVVVGIDAWYLRHYDGILFNTFTGDAVYVGPTLFVQINPKMFMTAAWEYQVRGSDVDIPGSKLNLAEFSRQRAQFKVAVEF